MYIQYICIYGLYMVYGIWYVVYGIWYTVYAYAYAYMYYVIDWYIWVTDKIIVISTSYHMAMDQYLLIPFLEGWTSINPSYFDVH